MKKRLFVVFQLKVSFDASKLILLASVKTHFALLVGGQIRHKTDREEKTVENIFFCVHVFVVGVHWMDMLQPQNRGLFGGHLCEKNMTVSIREIEIFFGID